MDEFTTLLVDGDDGRVLSRSRSMRWGSLLEDRRHHDVLVLLSDRPEERKRSIDLNREIERSRG